MEKPRQSEFSLRDSKGSRLFSLFLKEYATTADYAEAIGGRHVALFKHPRKRSPHLGTVHISKERGEVTDVIHEAVHVVARAAHVINRLPINEKTEEAMAKGLEALLPHILGFYGYKIVKKE